MFWRSRYCLPITVEELGEHEEAWLNSGESDEYGSRSYFIDRHYTGEERQTLWSERGRPQVCSTLPSDFGSRRRPCASLTLRRHQAGYRTFTSKLSSMLGTQQKAPVRRTVVCYTKPESRAWLGGLAPRT